jgi:hypothetical protein
MNLDDITTQIRLRSAWEAIDLGFAMVRHHARGLFPAWLLLLATSTWLLWMITPNAYREYIGMLIWWLKPLYDRILLHSLSHLLFKQRLSTLDILKAMPRLLWHSGLLGALTIRRFSFSRGFNLPIWQLEQLRGKARVERQDLLHLQTHSHAVWLTIGCIHLEYVLIFSMYLLMIMFDPTDTVWDYWASIFNHTKDSDVLYWNSVLQTVTYTIAIGIIEPLYIAASFSLYLNRRTQLEAWDIELAFRHLGARLSAAARAPLAVLLLSLCCLGIPVLTPQPAWAGERLPVTESAAQIHEVMQRDELAGMRTDKQWVLRDPKKHPADTLKDAPAWQKALSLLVANATKTALWIIVIVGIVLAIFYRLRIIAFLKPLQRKTLPVPPPDILFGMDIRPESLPADIAAACRQLWEAQRHREALSLLYRAALMRLTRHNQLAIQDSHTEGDILQLAQAQLSPTRMAWLTATTHAWQEIAYAHRIPADARVLPLFEEWL